MPFVAELYGNRVDATLIDPRDWDALRGDVALTMPECGRRAIPKRSPLGTRFFAHYACPVPCDFPHSPESEQHLRLKGLIADAVRSVPGWRALPEYAARRGGRWRADVLAWHPGLRHGVAIEVQLSPQTADDYLRRTATYHDDGVAVMWIANASPEMLNKEVPLIRLEEDFVGQIERVIPVALTFRAETQRSAIQRETEALWAAERRRIEREKREERERQERAKRLEERAAQRVTVQRELSRVRDSTVHRREPVTRTQPGQSFACSRCGLPVSGEYADLGTHPIEGCERYF